MAGWEVNDAKDRMQTLRAESNGQQRPRRVTHTDAILPALWRGTPSTGGVVTGRPTRTPRNPLSGASVRNGYDLCWPTFGSCCTFAATGAPPVLTEDRHQCSAVDPGYRKKLPFFGQYNTISARLVFLMSRRKGMKSGALRDRGVTNRTVVELAVTLFTYDPISCHIALVATIGTEERRLVLQSQLGVISIMHSK